MKNVVIFAIDDGHDLHQQAKFLRHLDTRRSMGRLIGEVKLCIGMWEATLERSYAMNREDYKDDVRGSGFVDTQHSVVLVTQDGRVELRTPGLTTLLEDLGHLRLIPKDQLGHISGWTYVEGEGVYYAAG